MQHSDCWEKGDVNSRVYSLTVLARVLAVILEQGNQHKKAYCCCNSAASDQQRVSGLMACVFNCALYIFFL